jgi:hypothetical protein
MRKDGSEWWRLLDREEEAIAKRKPSDSASDEQEV